MKKGVLWFVIVILLVIVLIQDYEIKHYQNSEIEWVRISKLWREKLDTAMNRNERIYEQLNRFKDIRIQQLKEQIKTKKGERDGQSTENP